MRVPVWLLFGLILSILLMDIVTLLVVRAALGESLNLALDAALVEGISPQDLFKGKSFLREEQAREAALTYFRKNLNLDQNLENRFLRKTVLQLVFAEKTVQPMLAATATTTVQIMVPKLVGYEGLEVTVRKKQYYLQSYK